MKLAKLLFIFLGLHFYTGNAQVNTKPDPNMILGKWTIAKTQSTILKDGRKETRSTVYNVPPKITFSGDRFAVIELVKGENERYVWRIDNTTLSFLSVPENHMFADGKYEIIFTEKEKFTELEIITLDGNYSYTLLKENKQF